MQHPQNIDTIIESINNIQRAEAPNFFVTRANATLDKYLEPTNTWMPIQKPIWVVATLSMLFMVNVYLITLPNSKQINTTNSESSSEKSINDFANAYNLNSSTNY